MKNYLIVLVSIVLFSCSQNIKPKPVPFVSTVDTMRTLCMYVFKGEPTVNVVYRVVKDTSVFIIDNKGDSNTAIKQFVKDSLYYIPIYDTVRDLTGTPKLDSSGKIIIKSGYYPYPKQFIIIDGNKDFDSIVKAVAKMNKPDANQANSSH